MKCAVYFTVLVGGEDGLGVASEFNLFDCVVHH